MRKKREVLLSRDKSKNRKKFGRKVTKENFSSLEGLIPGIMEPCRKKIIIRDISETRHLVLMCS